MQKKEEPKNPTDCRYRQHCTNDQNYVSLLPLLGYGIARTSLVPGQTMTVADPDYAKTHLSQSKANFRSMGAEVRLLH